MRPVKRQRREELSYMDWERDIVAGGAKAVNDTTLAAEEAHRICHVLRRQHRPTPSSRDPEAAQTRKKRTY